MKLTLVGVSHHRAAIELRERVAMDADGCRRLAAELGQEAVVLSTCNRTELYTSVSRFHGGLDDAVAAARPGPQDQVAVDELAEALLRHSAGSWRSHTVASGGIRSVAEAGWPCHSTGPAPTRPRLPTPEPP